jgi:hypothetical protein
LCRASHAAYAMTFVRERHTTTAAMSPCSGRRAAVYLRGLTGTKEESDLAAELVDVC